MRPQCKTIFLLLFMILVVQGCSSSSSKKDLPGIDINTDKINTDFIIFEDPIGGSANSHKNNEFLIIRVKNLSDSQIEFSPGYIKLFAKVEDSWVPIDNFMKRPEIVERLPTTDEFPPGMDVTVIPWIPDMEEPTPVRIFFIGQNVGTGEKVGAYMDIELLP